MEHSLTDTLRKSALASGSQLFGVAAAEGFSSYEGKRHPRFYVSDARSVVVIGQHVADPALDLWVPAKDGSKTYSFLNEILANTCLVLASILAKEGKVAVISPYSGLFCKDAGALAGLGEIGRNNLLLSDEFGARVRLRAFVTDAALDRTSSKTRGFCEDCDRLCWQACPANAFGGGCYSRKTCEEYSERHKEAVTDNSYFYCRECELSCPVGCNTGPV